MPKIADYFRESPFETTAGSLAPETGEHDFVPLTAHTELLKQTENDLKERAITIRVVTSSIGGGKTWALSWLYRSFSEIEGTLPIGIPRLELRGQPERGFVEAVFRGIGPFISKIRAKLRSYRDSIPDPLVGSPAEYVWHALSDAAAFSLLSGGGSKLPIVNEIAPPSLAKTEGSIRLLLGLFRVLRTLGYVRLLILIDEVESLFLVHGRKDLFIFWNYIRGIFDEFQTSRGRTLPHMVMLLAGTSVVLGEISPGLIDAKIVKQTDATDFTSALLRRLSPPFTLTIQDEADVLEIAKSRIGEHRKRGQGQAYIPYDREAILFIWNNFGNLGDYCRGLQEMYELALRENASKITMSHAKKVVSKYL
jgi:hypothetical protein